MAVSKASLEESLLVNKYEEYQYRGFIFFSLNVSHWLLDASLKLKIFCLCNVRNRWKQEMFVKHACPPKLKCHCDLDLWPRNPKFNRGHLLVKTNHHTKVEDAWAMSSLVIDRTKFVYGQTDRLKSAKQYTPTSSKGGIIKFSIFLSSSKINKVISLLPTFHYSDHNGLHILTYVMYIMQFIKQNTHVITYICRKAYCIWICRKTLFFFCAEV